MQHPDEGTIHAWLDGQLPETEAAAIEAHASECAECAAVVAEARGLVAASSRIVSALDVVPGQVIPQRAGRKRAWYMSTQLRAAAAVLFVAGASFLVLRDRGSASLQDSAGRAVLTARAPEQPQAAAAPAPLSSKSPVTRMPAGSGTARETESRRAASEVLERDGVGEVAADATPAPVQAQPPAAVMLKASPVIVTGVPRDEAANRMMATAEPVKAEIELIRTDSSTAGVKTSVYRLAGGEELTLMETAAQPALTAQGKSATAGLREAEAGLAAPPPVPTQAARAGAVAVVPVSAITWVDTAGNRSYTLSGRLSKERLAEARKKIEALKPAVK
jgi:anti-sigma factor RsiW